MTPLERFTAALRDPAVSLADALDLGRQAGGRTGEAAVSGETDAVKIGRPRERFERLAWSAKTGRAFEHGGHRGYPFHGCGCEPCWDAYRNSASYQRRLEISRAASDKAAAAKAQP